MSEIIQCFGFTVEPLGRIPSLLPPGLTEAWAQTDFFSSARVTIEATGETQVFQVYGDDPARASLVAMEYGNKRAGNTV
jgi:hypothetical protein